MGTKGNNSRRRYSDVEQAETLAVLASNNGNVLKTADMTGVPRTTIAAWAKGDRRPCPLSVQQEKREELAERLGGLAEKMFDQAEAKIPTMSGKDATLAGAILLDKVRLLQSDTPPEQSPDDSERLALFRQRWGEAQRELHVHLHLPGTPPEVPTVPIRSRIEPLDSTPGTTPAE